MKVGCPFLFDGIFEAGILDHQVLVLPKFNKKVDAMAKKKAAKQPAASKIQVVEDTPAAGGKLTDEQKIKAKSHGWKASAIRLGAAANPGTETQALTDWLNAKYGDGEFAYQMVYQTLKPKEGGASDGGKRTAKNVAASLGLGAEVEAALALIKTAGGMKAAQKALDTVDAIHKATSKIPF